MLKSSFRYWYLRFGTEKPLNTYLKAKDSPHPTRFLKLEYVFCYIQKYWQYKGEKFTINK